MSFPWVVHDPPPPSRVFWVQGRANIDASRQFYEAAKALGITLVVLDEPGHWIEDDNGPYAHYREAFIPVSVVGDEGLAQRVVDAVRAYPHKVDGIVTISDVRLAMVARACEILGLPTSSPVAYERAGDKGATRELESAATGGDEGFIIKTLGELDHVLGERGNRLQFPLIVKPCTGWNSDCVVKARDEKELYAAVRRASARHADSANKSTAVVVEPYIDGPEIDANFVVLDGEVLFCDITDDFPCSGDLAATEGTAAANFMETLMDVPSGLPEDEKDMVRDSLRKSIARLGFDSGVFHVEARVRGSHARYEVCSTSGILDLHTREVGSTAEEPSCYLHEVNARPPGYINCVAALLAHGVDYYAVRLLLSLGSRENTRTRAVSRPFLDGKPQYVLGVCVLPPTRGGIMASEDAVLEFLEANPGLRRDIVHYQTVKGRGDVVQGPESNELWCVAYVIVASRKGRGECLELARVVREKFDYRLIGE
ncbi:ATP-grasp domain-containing protein [Candidatus Bathyarchaeota archaeon]|nr:ATP-grasp domain-containing protein [Candidatus Bathyarchaeota archaeon]